MQEYIPLIVTKTHVETANVKRITLATQNGEILPYRAGQFISFALPGSNELIRRSYSFCSAPGVDTDMSIAVKRIDNGLFSRKLYDTVKEGDILYSTGVSGLFTLPYDVDTYSALCFFAAGIGISPLLSLIKTALHRHQHIPIILFYSNRSAADTAFYAELKLLEAQFPERLHIVHLFSTSPNLAIARLSKELVPELLQQHNRNLKNSLYYVCGPYSYMRMVIYALEEMNIPSANIKKENFDTTITSLKPQPPDKESHNVFLNIKDKIYSFTSAYPDTILQAAEKNGLQLPFSCRNGVCGACAVNCTAGKVWHSANEVLTDEELSKGMILTCCAYPVDGDVSIKLS